MAWQSVAAPPAAAAPQYAHAAGRTACLQPPVNTVLPSIPANPTAASTTTVNPGTWTGDGTISYSYQWYKQGVAVAGATASTYAIPGGLTDVGKSLLALVKATNSVASTWALSNGATIATDPTADPYYSSVILLLHGNGTNGGTTFTDNSPTPKTPSTVVSAVTSTTQVKYGSAALSFNGAAYLQYANTTDWALGAGDWTIEFWEWRSVTKTDALVVSTSTDGSANGGWWLDFGPSDINMYGPASTLIIRVATGAAPSSAWVHWAITRSGTTVRCFKNGALVGTSTSSLNLGSTMPRVGGGTMGGFNMFFNGYLDDLRITKGVCRYTATFTPPAIQLPDA